MLSGEQKVQECDTTGDAMKTKAGTKKNKTNMQTKSSYLKYLLIILLAYSSATAQSPLINIDLKKEIGDMNPIWAWFGYDEPNYTYMKDGKKLLSEIAALSPVPVFVRTHNLLTTGDGTAALKIGRAHV